ncbi:MAG: hypothetical protein KDN18_15855 [Verrucomicrobiae bacterium]|nr:hypothetical protein [Verrucomicrobiae bacterium]
MTRSKSLRVLVPVLIASVLTVALWKKGRQAIIRPADSKPVVANVEPNLDPEIAPASQGDPALTAPAPRVVPTEPDAREVILALRQDVRWEAPIPEPTFAEFRAWTREYGIA